MALKPLNSSVRPLGQFDGYDQDYLTLLGGEVVTLRGILVNSGDRAAKDADGSDGYVGAPPNQRRPAVTRQLVSGDRPLFLADEGTRGYGTLFGEVVGGVAGRISTGGAVLGPHTATGSGKVTCWDKWGLFSVTLDAVDTTAVTGLVPSNPTLAVKDPLYATATGLLTPDAGASFEAALVVGRFMEFTEGGSLVTTPNSLVSALNSPTGSPAQQLRFTEAVFHFRVED